MQRGEKKGQVLRGTYLVFAGQLAETELVRPVFAVLFLVADLLGREAAAAVLAQELVVFHVAVAQGVPTAAVVLVRPVQAVLHAVAPEPQREAVAAGLALEAVGGAGLGAVVAELGGAVGLAFGQQLAELLLPVRGQLAAHVLLLVAAVEAVSRLVAAPGIGDAHG